jgi:hypothetical protein
MGVVHPSVLDPALQIQIYLTDMRREYLPNDIFDALSSEYINPTADEPQALPNAIYLKLQAEVDQGRTCKVAMVKDLYAAPTLGSAADQRGNEEDIETKWFQQEYTDLSHATTNQQYGIFARDKAPYKVFEYRVEGLAKYFKQYFGKMRRQALLELQSENLEMAPIFNPSGFSPNFFFPNITFANQPTYIVDQFEWVDRLVSTMLYSGTGANASVSLNFLIKLEEWARTVALITPISFGDGEDGYILTLPSPQMSWLLNIVQQGSAGNMFTQVTAFPDASGMNKFPNAIWKFRGLRIVVDERYPTLTLGGTPSGGHAGYGSGQFGSTFAGYTLTAKYRGMGQADDGSSDPRDKTATARQVGFLIGQAALCEWMPENFHWEWDYNDYDKYFGSGIFCSVGIKQPIFRVTGGADDTIQQNGSICIPFATPPEINYYTPSVHL